MVRWKAVALAAAALVAATAAAFGPARPERAEIAWPAGAAVERRGDVWSTPLLLSSHRAERLSVTLPCPAGDALVFSTGRDGGRGYRLHVWRAGEQLHLQAGPERAASVAWPAEPGCEATLVFNGGDFELRRGGTALVTGSVFPPSVSGFYTGLAPGQPGGVTVELRGQPFGSSPSMRQWVLTVVAVLLAASALRVLWRATPRRARWARRRRDKYDSVAFAVLALAWVAAPLFFDDGWLMATVRARESGGSFNNYFDTFATQLPLGFLHHVLLWPFARLDAPMLWWRLVPLAAGAGVWLLLRRALPQVIGGNPSSASLVALTAAFSLGLFGWLMTLRPEPVVALLSLVVLLCALRYRTGSAPRSLAGALVASALAGTLHPSGVVAAAPLLLVIPTLWRRRRDDAWVAVTGVLAGATVGVLALFADTDVALWRRHRAVFASDGFHGNGILDEDIRYEDLLRNGTPARLVTVVFGLIVVLLFLLGLVRQRLRYRNPAGFVLVAAALLLTLTPSKWIYHFGSGAALLALALATTAHEQAARRAAPRSISVGVVLAVALGVGRCLRSQADAQYFWRLDTADTAALSRWWLWMLVGVLAVAAGREAARRYAIPAALATIALLTIVLHVVVPTAAGPSWAPGRRLVPDALRNSCGIETLRVSELTDRIALPTVGTASGLPADDARAEHPHPLELPPVHVYATDVLGDETQGILTTPWFELAAAPGRDVVAGFKGATRGSQTSVLVEWGGSDRAVLSRRPAEVAYPPGVFDGFFGWRMVRLNEALSPPPAATYVRFVLTDRSAAEGGAVAVTTPVALRSGRLGDYLNGPTLISPPQLSTLWCAEPAGITAGVAQAPHAAWGFVFDQAVLDSGEIGSGPSPWYLAEDAYGMRRVWVWLTARDASVLVVRADQ